MAYNPNNPNGQALAAASAPVVLASNITPPFSLAEAATGGASMYHLVSAPSTNPVNIKASAGKVTGLDNKSAAFC